MLFAFLSGFKFLTTRVEGDLTDQLHYYMTSNLLIALAILVSWKQFGGRPIECMIPETFHQPWEQYAENFCWAESTYYVPFDVGVPTEEDRNNKRINYYQWVPFYLMIAAVTFQGPCLFWKLMAGHSGIQIHDLVEESADRKNLAPMVRQETIRFLTVHIENALRYHRRTVKRQVTPHNFLRLLNLPYTAIYVTSCYMMTKLLYLVNLIVQFYAMNQFLDTKQFSFFGFGAVSAILNGSNWQESGIFPRVTMCDMMARTMGNLQRHSFQCVLTINLFNEKIFLFLWLWYGVLFFMTAFSLLYWAIVTLSPCFSRAFINRHLALSEIPIDIKASKADIHRFITKYLRTDGVFVLRVVTVHAGVVFGTDLIANLYRSFYGIEETRVQQKNKDQPNNENNKSESAAPTIVRYNEDPVDYEHCAEENAINRFAQQLAHIRLRNKHRNSQSEDSANLFRASLGQSMTAPAYSRAMQGGQHHSGNGPVPIVNKHFVPKPLNEPKFTASKKAKLAAQQAIREKERELQEKIEKETGTIITENVENEDYNEEGDDNALEAANAFNLA